MSDFDLSQALEGPSKLDEIRFESCCFNMTGVQEEIFRLDEGLDMVVSHNPKTMRRVATLVLVVNRMKKPLAHRSRELSDNGLCSMIMDSVVEETIVNTTLNFSTGGTRRTFMRVDSGNQCTLCDASKKDIVCESGGLQLQAVTLKGGHSERKVNFKVSRYISPTVSANDGQTVALSITNTNLHISCSMKDGKAKLDLEACSKEDLQMICDDRNMDRFLFYKTDRAYSEVTFESVKCRNWFISTSYEGENQPVEMCEKDSARRLTSFRLN